jgi:hypothetical protein
LGFEFAQFLLDLLQPPFEALDQINKLRFARNRVIGDRERCRNKDNGSVQDHAGASIHLGSLLGMTASTARTFQTRQLYSINPPASNTH